MKPIASLRVRVLLLGAALLPLAACRQDMHDQPKYKPNGVSKFFADGRNNRPLPPNTVARGRLEENEHLYTGKVNGELATTFPMAISAELLARGKERYNVFCTPCHDYTGNGNGMVVQRGMKQPPSYHIQRLRDASPGYFFDVITNGFGVMYDYSDRIPAQDRWAIVAYVRALQRSENATLADVPADQRRTLEGTH